jgi:glutaredoxin
VLAGYLYLIFQLSGKNNSKRGSRRFRTLFSNGSKLLSPTVEVTVYSKPGCHLCDEAKEAIRAAGCNDQITLTEINIENDPELMSKYRYDIPVIAINGVDTFMHRIDPTEFRERIFKLAN